MISPLGRATRAVQGLPAGITSVPGRGEAYQAARCLRTEGGCRFVMTPPNELAMRQLLSRRPPHVREADIRSLEPLIQGGRFDQLAELSQRPEKGGLPAAAGFLLSQLKTYDPLVSWIDSQARRYSRDLSLLLGLYGSVLRGDYEALFTKRDSSPEARVLIDYVKLHDKQVGRLVELAERAEEARICITDIFDLGVWILKGDAPALAVVARVQGSHSAAARWVLRFNQDRVQADSLFQFVEQAAPESFVSMRPDVRFEGETDPELAFMATARLATRQELTLREAQFAVLRAGEDSGEATAEDGRPFYLHFREINPRIERLRGRLSSIERAMEDRRKLCSESVGSEIWAILCHEGRRLYQTIVVEEKASLELIGDLRRFEHWLALLPGERLGLQHWIQREYADKLRTKLTMNIGS
jgi:hypothetical protein